LTTGRHLHHAHLVAHTATRHQADVGVESLLTFGVMFNPSVTDFAIRVLATMAQISFQQAQPSAGRVENTFFRYKSIVGDTLHARSPAGQRTEVVLACNILNQMTQRGSAASYAIGR
jgi:hypothetical protein